MGQAYAPLTLRLSPDLHGRLKFLSTHVDESMNRIASEAIELHLEFLGGEVAFEAERTLARIRERAERDPDWEQAIDAAARAEAELHDPAEGRAVAPGAATRTEAQRELDALLGDG